MLESGADVSLQEVVVELQSYTAARVTFNSGKLHFGIKSTESVKFPQFSDKVTLFFMAFPTLYLLKSDFSWPNA